MKFWRRRYEWVGFAACYGVEDFTLPPERDDGGPTANGDAVAAICSSCTVRPECAQAAHDGEWNSVWSCGTWIPGHDEDRRAAALVRIDLLASIPSEVAARGEDV